MMMEGSGSVPLTNKSGRPEKKHTDYTDPEQSFFIEEVTKKPRRPFMVAQSAFRRSR
jgi:hypothetical protein